MTTITIPKKEYLDLLEKKLRYEYLHSALADNIFAPPTVRSRKAALALLSGTKRYSKKFLESVGRGLSRSTYFK